MTPLEIQATVIGVLGILGVVIKRFVPDQAVQNRWIPAILLVIGTPLYASIAEDWGVLSLCTGLIAAAGAIGLHQTAQQTTGKSL